MIAPEVLSNWAGYNELTKEISPLSGESEWWMVGGGRVDDQLEWCVDGLMTT